MNEVANMTDAEVLARKQLMRAQAYGVGVVSILSLEEARSWAADCTWPDREPADVLDPAKVTDREIMRAVYRHWDGGLSDFLEAVTCA